MSNSVTITIGSESTTIPLNDTTTVSVQTVPDGGAVGTYVFDHSLCINRDDVDAHPQYLVTADADNRYAPKSHPHTEYLTLEDISNDFSSSDHNHNELYLKTTDAASLYAPVDHHHNDEYYTKNDSNGLFASKTHDHNNYLTESQITSAYAALDHDHMDLYYTQDDINTKFTDKDTYNESKFLTITNASTTYATLTHSHADDGTLIDNFNVIYAAVNHTHTGVYLTEIEANSLYATLGHNHDTVYLKTSDAEQNYAPKSHANDSNIHFNQSDIRINVNQITDFNYARLSEVLYTADNEQVPFTLEHRNKINQVYSDWINEFSDPETIYNKYHTYNSAKFELTQKTQLTNLTTPGFNADTYHTHTSIKDRSNHVGTQSTDTVINKSITGSPAIANNLTKLISNSLSAGILSTPIIIINDNNTGISVSNTIEYLIKDGTELKVGTILDTSVKPVSDGLNILYIDNNNGTVSYELTSDIFDINLSTKVPVAVITKSGEYINILNINEDIIDNSAKQRKKSFYLGQFNKESGGVIDTSDWPKLKVSGGYFWFGLERLNLEELTNTGGLYEVYLEDDTWVFDVIDQSSDSIGHLDEYNNLNWTSVENNKFYNKYLYYVFSDQTNNPYKYYLVHGQNQYNTIEESLQAKEPVQVPDLLKTIGVLVGAVVMQNGSYVGIYSPYCEDNTLLFNSNILTKINNLTNGNDIDNLNYHSHDSLTDRANHTGTQTLTTVNSNQIGNSPSSLITNLDQFNSYTESAGIINTPYITIGAESDYINVENTVEFIIREEDSDDGILKTGKIDAVSNISISEGLNILCINYDLGNLSYQIDTDPNDINMNNRIPVALINKTTDHVYVLVIGTDSINSNAKLRQRMFYTEPFIRESGAIVSTESNNNRLQIAATEGKFWFGLSKFNSYALEFNGSVNHTYLDVTNTWVINLIYQNTNGYPNLNYYNSNVSVWTPVTHKNYYNLYLYYSFSTSNNYPYSYYLVHGQAEYSSLEEARLVTAPNLLPEILQTTGTLMAVIVMQEGDTVNPALVLTPFKDDVLHIASQSAAIKWRDLVSPLSAANLPTASFYSPELSKINDTAYYGYNFEIDDYVYCQPIQIGHDIRPNSEAYISVAYTVSNDNSGSVKWELQLSRALKSDTNIAGGNTVFSNSNTITINIERDVIDGDTWKHIIAESSTPITLYEPDEIILIVLKRVSTTSDTNASVLGLTVNIHYQSDTL